MNALQAVTTPEATSDHAHVTITDTYDARMDPEATLLCALLWATEVSDHITAVVAFLSPADFRRPAHAKLFSLIAEAVATGQPLTPAVIAATCDDAGSQGRDGWPGGITPQQFILDIASLGALPAQVSYLANHVIRASYRAQFQSMTTYLTQVGEEAGVDDLFDQLVQAGRTQRAAKARLDRFNTEILNQPIDDIAG